MLLPIDFPWVILNRRHKLIVHKIKTNDLMTKIKKIKKNVAIFSDGACRGNPGPGGWGAVLRFKNYEKKICGAACDTTNNRMELTAAIEALSKLKEACLVDLTTDSKYLKDGITKWLPQWKANNYKKKIKNLDLWLKLDALTSKHDITWHWVRGHSGHRENEIADQLANQALDKLLCVK